MVPQVDRWLTAVVDPATRYYFGQPLAEIKVLASYSCRPMNSVDGAKLSEHGRANAIDVGAFVLADGSRISVKEGWRGSDRERAFLRQVHDGARPRSRFPPSRSFSSRPRASWPGRAVAYLQIGQGGQCGANLPGAGDSASWMRYITGMSWHRKGASEGRRAYHHGNLREALIEAALKLISEKGPSGVTFAEAARSAGVSPAAPYRHFRDRDALMADVAKRGFERFEAVLSQAWDEGRPEARAAFDRLGRAYLAFARKEPAYFSAMFESGLDIAAYPEVRQAGDNSFEVLRKACEALVATMPASKRPPAMMMALHVWSLSHGIAALFGRGDASRRAIPMTPEDLLEAATLIYLKGLGMPAA